MASEEPIGRGAFKPMRGAWAQPGRIADHEHLAKVVPLIDLDREWASLRRSAHIYLATAYGLSLFTCMGVIAQFKPDTPRQVFNGVLLASLLFSGGLVVVAVAFVFDLWAGWITMRNRKRMFAGEEYFIGFVESALCLLSGLLLILAALAFALIISLVIWTAWRWAF